MAGRISACSIAVCPYASTASPTPGNKKKLYKKNSGPCKAKTCSDVRKCIKRSCAEWNEGSYYVFVKDCHTFTYQTIGKCCLTSYK